MTLEEKVKLIVGKGFSIPGTSAQDTIPKKNPAVSGHTMSIARLGIPVSSFRATLDTADARNVTLTWKKNTDAVGYNIRYGIEPNKLYENYQVFDVDSLTIHSLSKNQKYYFTIDAFNENGITKGKTTIEGR